MLKQKDYNDLYSFLVDACQQYGFTTEATYDALHTAVASIVTNAEDVDNA